MTLRTDITSTIPALVRDARTMEQRAEDKLRGINNRGGRQLQQIARSVVHVRSGRLQRGLVLDGPFDVASGTLEARVSAPSVPYAEEEIARGGEHDFAARTLEAGRDVIAQVARDMEKALIDVMEGR